MSEETDRRIAEALEKLVDEFKSFRANHSIAAVNEAQVYRTLDVILKKHPAYILEKL